MTVPRVIGTVAVLTGLAVGAAGVAAAAPTMSGHYIMTVTSGSGPADTRDWYFTPCGDGCASVAVTPDGPAFGQAQFRDGLWTLVWHSDAFCPNGSRVPGAISSYDTWDPITLAGTDQLTGNRQICEYLGQPRLTNNIQLTPAG